ncbi:hypothetical protein JKP88DRAFT_194413 [Tribonema minus]|uniref:Rubredoxin-like domain-containing protein n=1 Tax=Tribonema minus TaxID=303371 RepID=A0A835Z4L2_9STRA|nr:hypothetical protein JKP88DRAFT_194413 [Tribonema minus]
MMAEARERVASAMKTGSLVDPAERIRLQQQRNQPGSARGEIFANLAVLGVLVGSVYFAGKSYFTRQETLVEGYASEMTDVISSSTEMDACHKEYKRKLGPKQFRGEMFAAFITELARKKPITCQTMMAADYVRRKFGFKDVKVAKLLAAAGQAVARKQPGLRSKLLFYGQRLSGSSDAAAKQLQPLKDLLAQSYRSGGAQIVESASISIAEQALRDSAHASGELPEGWELLGMSEAQARETLGEGGGEAMYAKLVKEAKDRDAATEAAKGGAGRGGGSSEEGTARAFECGSCGYTLYVAKGREWKFFGDDFKCPECGASKGKFQEKGVGGTGEP